MPISRYLSDFVAGVDPTGVNTFSGAMKHENNHFAHQLAGDAGGFAGGYAIGAILPAAVAGAGSLVLRKRSPGLAKTFRTTASDTMATMNPKKIIQSAKTVPYAIKYKNYANSVLKSSRTIEKDYRKLRKSVSSSPYKKYIGSDYGNTDFKRLSDLSKKLPKESNQAIDRLRSEGSNLYGTKRKMDVLDRYSQRYLGRGSGLADSGAGSLTTLLGIGGGVGSGLLNASSAHMQYSSALKKKKEIAEKV